MNKIVVISMVKNEADILESFVRHCFSFADEMLVVDHNSSDQTGAILRALQAEGLALHVRKYLNVELAHAEVMNQLLQEAVEEYGADIVLPADADEFLLPTESEQSCREILQHLDTNRVYLLHWWSFEPVYPEMDPDTFLLYRPCRRGRQFAAAQKSLVGAGIVKSRPVVQGKSWALRLVQGCHYAYWQSDDGEKADMDMDYVDDLRVAHFHWRSDAQYMSKIVVSWINNVAKYSMNTFVASYLKGYFDKIRQGGRVCPEDFLQDAVEVDLRPYCSNQPMRYANQAKPDVLHNLMAASEAMAEAYAEEKLLRRQLLVSVIIPFSGDIASLSATLKNLSEQTYPFLEIIVYSCIKTPMVEAAECVGNYHGKGTIQYISEEGSVAQRMKCLPRYVHGAYVQWVLPGQCLAANRIGKLLACVENYDYGVLDCVLTYGMGNEACPDLYVDFGFTESFNVVEAGVKVFAILMSASQPLAGGISAALFSRSLMENCRWFADGVVGNRFFELIAWEQVFIHSSHDIGILKETLSWWWNRKTALENIIWYQLTLPLYVDKYKVDGGKTVKNIQRLGRIILNLAREEDISSELLQQYRDLFFERNIKVMP